jgi:hypothetical protein
VDNDRDTDGCIERIMNKLILPVLALALVVAACSSSDTAAETTVSPISTAPVTTTEATTTALPVIGPGTYIVPDEVAADTYRLAGYAARLDDELEIIDNYLIGDNGFGIVIVQPTDSYLEVDGGVVTVDAFGHPLDPIAEEFTSGVYLVGYDIAPGRYRVQPEDGTSYWGRLDGTLDIIDNNVSDGATIVIIKQSDFALEFTGRLELLP